MCHNGCKGEILIEFMVYLSVIIILFSAIYIFYIDEKKIYEKYGECREITDFLAENINQGYINNYYLLSVSLPAHECKIYLSGKRVGCISEKCDYIVETIPYIELTEGADLSKKLQLRFMENSVVVENPERVG